MPKLLSEKMDERGKSGAFVDVKDSSEHGENIFEETVDVLFRKPTFVIMSLPFHFREAGSTRLLLLTFQFYQFYFLYFFCLLDLLHA